MPLFYQLSRAILFIKVLKTQTDNDNDGDDDGNDNGKYVDNNNGDSAASAHTQKIFAIK